jgi:hypothetical protein
LDGAKVVDLEHHVSPRRRSRVLVVEISRTGSDDEPPGVFSLSASVRRGDAPLSLLGHPAGNGVSGKFLGGQFVGEGVGVGPGVGEPLELVGELLELLEPTGEVFTKKMG